MGESALSWSECPCCQKGAPGAAALCVQRWIRRSRRRAGSCRQRRIGGSSPGAPLSPSNAPPGPRRCLLTKLTQSRKKVPKGEAGLAQARLVANLIDGFREVRAAHRAQQQADRRLPIEDQAAAAAPRGRAPSRAQSSSSHDKTPEYTTKGGQLVLTDANKRGRSPNRSESRVRDATPEYPVEGTVLLLGFNKKARVTPQGIMRHHFKKNYKHLRPKRKPTLPTTRRRPPR